MSKTCDSFLIIFWGCMSSCHVVLLSVSPAIVEKALVVQPHLPADCCPEREPGTLLSPFDSRFFLDHSALPHPRQVFFSSVFTLPNKGVAMCYGHVQPPHTTERNLDLTVPPHPPSPQFSLFPVPSCLTIWFFFPFPAQQSCPIYWVCHDSIPLHLSHAWNNPPLSHDD